MLPAQNRSTTLLRSSRRETRPRVVAVLTPRERALFLDRPLDQSDLAPGIAFLPPPEVDEAGWIAHLDEWQPEVLLTGWSTPPLPPSWLARPGCPLRYVCHVTGSVRPLVPRSFIERGGLVTNWGERISGQVAEHGLLLALATLRNQAAWPAFIARPVAERQITDLRTRTLFGARVGLHGFGSVARALLPLLRPFGVTVSAYSAGVPGEIMAHHHVRPAASLLELFRDSAVLFECEALTPATIGCVTAEVLAALPDGAVFVNIGRGGLVDDAALVREGHRRRISLGLDVISAEPVAPDSAFVGVPGIMLSPHIGGPTSDRYPDCGAHALANVARFLAGHPPVGLISLAMYDRAT